MSGTLTSIDTEKGTVTVKGTGSQVVVITYKARIENKNDSRRTYQLSDLKRYIGRDIRLEGLSRHDNKLYANLLKIDTGR